MCATKEVINEIKNDQEVCLFFDTETSGFISGKKSFDDPTQAWCVQLAAVLATKHTIIETMNVIIKPNGRTMNHHAAAVHGISLERAQEEGIDEKDALELFSELLTDTPKRIAHNFDFDSLFISQMFERNMDNLSDQARSKYFLQLPHFCTMKDKRIKAYCDCKNVKGYPKYAKLEEMYEILFKTVMPNAHDAMADVIATKDCYYELLKKGII